MNFRAAVRDPSHEEHTQMMEWIGGAFDPEHFDIAAVTAQMTKRRAK